MIERFNGADGERLRIEAISRQQIVQNNIALAKKHNAVATLVQLEVVALKNVCIQQDSAENDLYFILAGKVSVCVHGREVAIRHAGQHVGEMALLDPGKPRCATVKALETTVAAKISEAAFTPIANKHPQLWRALAIELANRLRERNKYVKAPNSRPVVFIGSSMEERLIAFEIRDGLSRENVLPKDWADDLFKPSATSIENLEREVEVSDFAVMVVTPDDAVISRHKKKVAPRDNVLWEHGLFLGGLGRKRVYIVKPRAANLKLPSDLLGVTPLDFDPVGTPDDLRARLGSAINSIRKEVERLGPK